MIEFILGLIVGVGAHRLWMFLVEQGKIAQQEEAKKTYLNSPPSRVRGRPKKVV